ncbi:MAG: TonB-dependent receptor plug domain-containing protein [Steroidobacteraceae bacterium]
MYNGRANIPAPQKLAPYMLMTIGLLTAPWVFAQQQVELTDATTGTDILEEVLVVAGRVIPTQQGALRADIVKTESLDAAEMQRTGATNLNELFAHRPGLDAQVECSVCSARSISLNNMPGRFTTLMVDGVPIFSSVSNAYGQDMLGLTGLERIDVSRGAGTSLIAPESLAGTVNMVSKQPGINTLEVDVRGGRYGQRLGSLYAAHAFEGGAVSVSGTHDRYDPVDTAGLGISQFSGYERTLGGIGLFVDDLAGFKTKVLLNFVDERRMGGPLSSDYAAVRADTSGNPFNFSAGPNGSPDPNAWINPGTQSLMPNYDGGRFGVAQIVYTKRQQLVATAERRMDDMKLRLAVGLAHHEQDSWYGLDAEYFGKQTQGYGEVSLQFPMGETSLTAGANLRYEDLRSHSMSLDISSTTFGIMRVDADAYIYRTPAVFLQGYRAFDDGRLELNGSVRYDRNNVFGSILTPRVNALWHHTKTASSRIAVGTGFRLPTSFFELDHAILSAPAVDRSQAKPEKSLNGSYAWNYADDRLALTASLNYTRIRDMALFMNDLANSGSYLLRPAPSSYSITNGDVVSTWQLTAADSLSLGYERYCYDFRSADFAGTLFSRPAYRATFSLDHSRGRWDLDLQGSWTGPQDLARFYAYSITPRYNLDGTGKRTRAPAFLSMDLRVAYQWTAAISGYAGVRNLTDYTQAERDSFLWVDDAGRLDVTHIWGPYLDRTWYAGIKLTL